MGSFFLPVLHGNLQIGQYGIGGSEGVPVNDIVVNINQDDVINKTAERFLSDRDSTGRGHVTHDYGDTYVDNSEIFTMPKSGTSGGSGKGVTSGKDSARGRANLSKVANLSSYSTDSAEYPIAIDLIRENAFSQSGGEASAVESEWTKIPSTMGINRKNALYLSNDGSFSFNTEKFKNYEYFRAMKSKIAQSWFPPIGANTYFPEGRNSLTGGFTPGYTKTSLLSSQEVMLYFVMDRSGTVKEIVIVRAQGKNALVESCASAIKNARNFGPVPAEIAGSAVVIPFVFVYLTN